MHFVAFIPKKREEKSRVGLSGTLQHTRAPRGVYVYTYMR